METLMSSAAAKTARIQAEDQDRPLLSPLVKIVLAVCVLGLLAVYSYESLPLLGLGMLPTLGAAFAGRNEKGVWISVGWMNLAGLSYWLLDLWSADHSMSYASAQLRTVVPILVSYGAAALGWFLYLGMPAVTGAFIAGSLRRWRNNLQSKQTKLVEQWDSGITSPIRNAPPAKPQKPAPK
jgi:hypothetical protein